MSSSLHKSVVIFVSWLAIGFWAQDARATCAEGQVPSKIVGCVGLEWSAPGPQFNKNSPFALIVRDSQQQSVTIQDAAIRAILWMDMGHHSHGSKPTTTTLFPLSGFVFVDQVYFVMKGKWQIKIQVDRLGEDKSVVETEELVILQDVN